MEVAGTVVKVGERVEGSLARRPRLRGDADRRLRGVRGRRQPKTFPVHARLDWPVAAALPMIVPTAYALLHELGRVRQGDRILVNATAGGTGMVLGQMASHVGAHAVGVVSSPEKAEVARRYGFEEVLTTAEVDAGVLEPRSLDLMLDSVGGEARSLGWEALAPFGMLIAYGNTGGAPRRRSPGPSCPTATIGRQG
jgi:NADPH2:quinone reductase